MARVDDYFNQAKRNLKFLERINSSVEDSIDWQVTVCFYTALHLVNSHLANFNMQYRTHKDVNHALNPEVVLSPSKLPAETFQAYIALTNLSRRSRYLVNTSDGNIFSELPAFTYSKHLAKALRHLNTVLAFYSNKYGVSFAPIDICCSDIRQSDHLAYYNVVARSAGSNTAI